MCDWISARKDLKWYGWWSTKTYHPNIVRTNFLMRVPESANVHSYSLRVLLISWEVQYFVNEFEVAWNPVCVKEKKKGHCRSFLLFFDVSYDTKDNAWLREPVLACFALFLSAWAFAVWRITKKNWISSENNNKPTTKKYTAIQRSSILRPTLLSAKTKNFPDGESVYWFCGRRP